MRIRVELNGTAFEYDCPPMKESRFQHLCALAAGGLYIGLTWVIGTLCGIGGLIVLGVVTAIVVALDSI